VCFL